MLRRVFVLLLSVFPLLAQPATQEVPLSQRIWIATQIYAFVRTNFGHWRGIPQFDFDHAYRDYIDQVLVKADRRDFDLLTMALIAQLKNGHSGFSDKWLRDHYGQRLGFFATPIDGKWTVTRSDIPELRIGDALVRIDGEPMDAFYARERQYLSASDERWAKRALFENPFLFPPSFDLELEGGRHVSITRRGDFQWAGSEAAETTSREEAGALYVRVPSFRSRSFEDAAIAAVKAHPAAKAIIVDVRGNHGGSTPGRLVASLMDRPYEYYEESTPVGLPLFASSRAEIRWPADAEQPHGDAYKGSVYLLVDGGCFSACEDFTMPFKNNKRAVIVGETTAGSSGQPIGTSLGDGMSVGVSAKREYFPNGAEFEGAGIAPDIVVHTTVDDLRNGRDPVLEKVRQLIAAQP